MNGRFDPGRDNYTCISTRGKSVVDYIIAPKLQLQNVHDLSVTTVTDAIERYDLTMDANTKIPDHSMVNCTVSMSQFYVIRESDCRQRTTTANNGRPRIIEPVHRRYRVNILPTGLFENERSRRILSDMIDRLHTAAINQDQIDNTYQEFIDHIHSEMDCNLEYKDYTPGMQKRKKRSKPYWDDDLAAMWSHARDCERDYLKHKGCNAAQRELRMRFIESRGEFDKALRRAQRRYNAQQQERISTLRTDNPKEFWREIRKLGPGADDTTHPSSVISDDGTIVDDPETVLARWKRDFQSLYETAGVTAAVDPEFITHLKQLSSQWEAEYETILRHNPRDQEGEMAQNAERVQQAANMLNRPITLAETVNTLRHTRNGKAVGIDNVANEIIKVPALQTSLHALYVRCFELNIVPRMWYRGIIHPVLKRGKSPLFPLNYRGISLMSTICKVFSAILNNRLTLFAEVHDIYADEQNGFRKLRSCLDHLFVLNTILRNRKQQRLDTYCCFVDFAKAFDSVNYDALWHKLLAYGVHGNMLRTIKSLYANLQNCVRVNGRLTDWFSQTAGVRQGDTLAPTLFALYINDLAMEINTLSEGVPIDGECVSVLMYADDVVLISESEEGLQKMLDTLNAWSHDWMLALNYDKTKVVHFHRANSPPTQRDFAIGDNSIDRDCYYRYLGFEFCDTIDHNHGVNVLNRAASKALGSVTSKYFALDGTSYDVYKNMYDSLVCPVMDYACEIWGVKSYSFVNTTQHRAMRTYLGVGKVTPLPAMYGDMPWITPYTRHRSAAVRYWHRLTRMPETRLTRRVFNWDYELACRGRPSWNKDIHQILTTCDIPELLDQCNWHTCSSDRLVTQVTSKLTQLESRQRSMDGAPMSRLRVYNELDTPTATPASYVTARLSRKQRSLLAKLRSGTLPLALETGRYTQTPVNQRLCRSCNTNAIETELHFLFECDRYNDIRTRFLNRDNATQEGNHIEELLCMFSDKDMTRNLAIYMQSELELRTHWHRDNKPVSCMTYVWSRRMELSLSVNQHT